MKKQMIAFVFTLLSGTTMASDIMNYPERPEAVDYPVSSGEYRENLTLEVLKFKQNNEEYTKGVTFVVSPKEKMDAPDISAQTEQYTNGDFIIRIRDDVYMRDLAHIVYHEMGHVIYRRDMPYKLQRLYARVYRAEKACVSIYSCESATENFAEWYVWSYHKNDFVGRTRSVPKMRQHTTFFSLYENILNPKKEWLNKYGG